MFLYIHGDGGRVYEVVRELPDGLSFLCRRVRINDEKRCVINTDHNSIAHIRAVPESGDDIYFENLSLYRDWEDVVRDCYECEV